jgi:hypothetical protein
VKTFDLARVRRTGADAGRPGIGSVRPTEETSDAASRHGRKSKETPYFQRTDIIKDKIPALIKDKFLPANAVTAINKEKRQPPLRTSDERQQRVKHPFQQRKNRSTAWSAFQQCLVADQQG